MKDIISEILLQDKKKIKLMRVLLIFNTPIRKYPDFGVWCYLINSPKGVYVFDPGPKYRGGSPYFRQFMRLTHNVEKIMYTLKKYFPGKTVKEIIFSHYHYDHSELGPELQLKIHDEFGNLPPLRLHKKDYGPKILMKIRRDSLDRVYKKAGYSNWKMGRFVKNNELLEGTDFRIIHLPGHTHGTIGLINKKDKIVICGWWIKKIESKITRFSVKIINESNKKLAQTIEKLSLKNYSYYFYHPEIPKLKIKRKRPLRTMVNKIKQKIILRNR